MIKPLGWYFCLCIISFSSLASKPKATVLLDKTVSNRIIKLDLNEDDIISRGEVATLLSIVKAGGEKKLIPFARIKLIALNKSQSLWRVIRISRNYFKKGGKYLFVGLLDLSRGRSRVAFKTRGYIQKELPKSKDDFLKEQSQSFSQRLDFLEQEKLHKVREWLDPSYLVELTRFSKPEEKNEKILTLLQSIPLLELQNKYNIETYERIVLSYLEKFNNPLFQGDVNYTTDLRDENGFQDREKREEYKSFLKKRVGSLNNEDKALLKFWNRDKRWSSGISDSDLSKAIEIEEEILEQKRQQAFYLSRYSWQIYLGLGANLLNNQSSEATNSSSNNRFIIDSGVEYFIFKNNLRLKRFSLIADFRFLRDGIDASSSLNANFSDTSLGIGFNYYPFLASGSYGKPIIYIGPHIRFGSSDLEILGDSPESASYSSFGIGFRAGVLYRWSARWGASLNATFENNSLSSSSIEAGSNLPEDADYSFLGFGFRINYVF